MEVLMKNENNVWAQELSKLVARTDKGSIKIQKSGISSRKDKRQLTKATKLLGLSLLKETPRMLVYAVPQDDGHHRDNPVKAEDSK
jgi:indole-3-glycerol phosphate synthase